MSVKFETVEDIPTWATCWLMYGENDGLTPEDMAEVSAFVLELEAAGLRLVCPIDGTENEFCARPAFGLACAVQNWTAEKIGGGK